MNETLNKDGIKYIISRIVDRANDTIIESDESNDDFEKGKLMAYYEVLDMIKSELYIRDQDLKELGLDINLADNFFGNHKTTDTSKKRK